MAKIKVEMEVPDDNCLGCDNGRYVASDIAVCTLFNNAFILSEKGVIPKRCEACKKAETMGIDKTPEIEKLTAEIKSLRKNNEYLIKYIQRVIRWDN